MTVAARTATRKLLTHTDACIDATLYIQTEDDIRSHLCFGLGGVHTPVSIQRVRQQNVKTREGPEHHQYYGGNSRVDRQGDVYVRQANQQIHHPTSRSRNGQEDKTLQKEDKTLGKVGRYRVSGESSPKNGTRGGVRASKKKKTSHNQTNTRSRLPQNSASRSA